MSERMISSQPGVRLRFWILVETVCLVPTHARTFWRGLTKRLETTR